MTHAKTPLRPIGIMHQLDGSPREGDRAYRGFLVDGLGHEKVDEPLLVLLHRVDRERVRADLGIDLHPFEEGGNEWSCMAGGGGERRDGREGINYE